MNEKEQFNKNIAKIHGLKLSMWEKDSIVQAYYHHFNKIPLKSEWEPILKRHNIILKNGDVIVKKSLEDRRRGYREILNRGNERGANNNISNSNMGGIYKRNFSQIQSKEILQILSESNSVFNDCEKILSQCKEALDICFSKSELSYSMILNIIEKTHSNAKRGLQTLQDYLNPFIDLFPTLNQSSKDSILNKANELLEKLQTQKDLSANLCIKLFDIRANNATKGDETFSQYLKDTISKMDKYSEL